MFGLAVCASAVQSALWSVKGDSPQTLGMADKTPSRGQVIRGSTGETRFSSSHLANSTLVGL